MEKAENLYEWLCLRCAASGQVALPEDIPPRDDCFTCGAPLLVELISIDPKGTFKEAVRRQERQALAQKFMTAAQTRIALRKLHGP